MSSLSCPSSNTHPIYFHHGTLHIHIWHLAIHISKSINIKIRQLWSSFVKIVFQIHLLTILNIFCPDLPNWNIPLGLFEHVFTKLFFKWRSIAWIERFARTFHVFDKINHVFHTLHMPFTWITKNVFVTKNQNDLHGPSNIPVWNLPGPSMFWNVKLNIDWNIKI